MGNQQFPVQIKIAKCALYYWEYNRFKLLKFSMNGEIVKGGRLEIVVFISCYLASIVKFKLKIFTAYLAVDYALSLFILFCS